MQYAVYLCLKECHSDFKKSLLIHLTMGVSRDISSIYEISIKRSVF